jgi:hypothetical protein
MLRIAAQLQTLSRLLKIATQDPLDIHWNEQQVARICQIDYEPIALYDIDPIEFLKLTTSSQEELDSFLEFFKKDVKFFKSSEVQKDMQIPPFLIFNGDGKIVKHEGRHRAAAINGQGGSKFRILLAADECKKLFTKYGWRWKRKIPVPKELYGQFNNYRHKVDFSRIKLETYGILE